MALADTIYQLSLKLPDVAAQEALDFIEFLGQRYGTGGQASTDHDAWFRSEVQRALDDPRPGLPNEQVQKHFAARREALRLKTLG